MRKYEIVALVQDGDKFVEEVQEISAAKCGITHGGELFFADNNGNIMSGYAPGRWVKFKSDPSLIKEVK